MVKLTSKDSNATKKALDVCADLMKKDKGLLNPGQLVYSFFQSPNNSKEWEFIELVSSTEAFVEKFCSGRFDEAIGAVISTCEDNKMSIDIIHNEESLSKDVAAIGAKFNANMIKLSSGYVLHPCAKISKK